MSVKGTTGPRTDFGSGPRTDFGSGPRTDFGSGPSTDFGSGPSTDFGSGPRPQLSPKAEAKLKELRKNITQSTRNTLVTYDEEDQIKWIVNPMVQFLITRTSNELKTRNLQKQNTSKKPTPPPVVPSPPSLHSTDSDIDIFGDIFGNDEGNDKKEKKVSGDSIGNLFDEDDGY